MSDYPVVYNVGETLKNLLWKHMETDSNINQFMNEDDIILSSPADLKGNDGKKLSLYLYRIIENPFMKNREMEMQNNEPTRMTYYPMTADLFYLITADTGNIKNDQLLMGKVMQVFHDNPVLRGSMLLGDALMGTTEQIRLVFYSLPFEEIIQLWQSFSEKSFQLSICYQVTPVVIDSTQEIAARRVVEKEGQFSEKEKKEEKNV